jgi:hypothetical protein
MKYKLFLSVFLLLASVFSFSACGGSSDDASKPLTAQQIVEKAQKADLKSGEFTMDASTTMSGQTVPMKGKGKFTKDPKRMSMDLAMTVQGVDVTMSMVQDGATTYTKDSISGQWTKSTSTDDMDITGYDIKDPVLVGKETVGGVETYHIKGTDKSGSAQEYWFKTDTFYPIKGTITMKGESPMTGTLTISNWNGSITIDVPTV